MSGPLVSVAFISYQQKEFVAEALQGVLNQKDVDLEIVVGDDAGTDGTFDIITARLEQCPFPVRYLDRTERMGMLGNWHRTIMACQGRYVALLEGDDRWDDDRKLADQLQRMEADPTLSGCFTNARFMDEEGNDLGRSYVDPRTGDLTPKEYFSLDHNIIPTCTVLLRRSMVHDMPAEYWQSPFADWIVHSTMLAQGPYAYVDRFTSSYRVNAGGVWSSMHDLKRLQNRAKALGLMARYIPEKFRALNKQARLRAADRVLYALREKGDRLGFLRTWWAMKCMR